MSTKIYNGYCIEKNLSLLELNEFQREMQKMMHDFIYEKFCELYGNKIQIIVDRFTVLRTDAKKEELKNEICDLLNFSEKSLQNEIRDLIRGAEPKKRTLDSFTSSIGFTLANVVYDYLSKRIEAEEILYERNPCDLTADICVFPSEEKCLFMAFGLADEFFQTFLSSKENTDFIQKWGLREYHYQDQADRPEEISEEEWENRKKDWEKVFEHVRVPEKAGFTIHFFNEETDLFNFFSDLEESDFKDVLKYIPDPSVRLKKYAKRKLISDILGERSKQAKERKGPELIEIKEERIKDSHLEPYLSKYSFLEITPKLLKKNILDFQ